MEELNPEDAAIYAEAVAENQARLADLVPRIPTTQDGGSYSEPIKGPVEIGGGDGGSSGPTPAALPWAPLAGVSAGNIKINHFSYLFKGQKPTSTGKQTVTGLGGLTGDASGDFACPSIGHIIYLEVAVTNLAPTAAEVKHGATSGWTGYDQPFHITSLSQDKLYKIIAEVVDGDDTSDQRAGLAVTVGAENRKVVSLLKNHLLLSVRMDGGFGVLATEHHDGLVGGI